MTYSDKLHFTFNNIPSSTYNLLNIHMSSGFQEEQFLPTRTLQKTKIRGRNRTYLNDIVEEVRVINVEFGFSEPWNDTTIREIVNWFNVSYYSPLIFHSEITPSGDEKIFYCMPIGSSSILHAGLQTGYVKMQFECIDSYVYSPVYLSSTEYSSSYFLSPSQPIQIQRQITFENSGDVEIRPIMIITAHGEGFVQIINTTNEGKKIEFSGLSDGEILTLDLQNEILESSLGDIVYRINQLTSDSDWDFSFKVGNNYLEILGDFTLQFKYENKYYTN